MNTNKGFTLIELLAVIVVLAIIALIATPIILGVIETAEKGAAEASSKGYIDAVEKQVAINLVKGENEIQDGVYDLPMSGVQVKGNPPTSGWIEIEKSRVKDYSMVISEYTITKGAETVKNGTPTEKPITYRLGEKSIGEAVYVNPETNEICDLASYNANEGASQTTHTTGCMKWYVYKDNVNDGTYGLILDHNTTAGVAWNSSNSNASMNEVADALTSDTETWDSSLNIDLIDADDIADITGNDTWDVTTATTSNSFYFDTNTTSKSATCKSGNTTGCNYGWLYDRTKTDCEDNGCLNNADSAMSNKSGYWTKSAVSGYPSYVWSVRWLGSLDYFSASVDTYGVRPVITF